MDSMNRTLAQSVALCCLIATTGVGHAAVDDLTDVVPAGSPLVCYIGDVTGALDDWENSPLAALWNDPQVKTFFAPLREEMGIDRWDQMVRAHTGHGIDDIEKMLTGDLVLYIEDVALHLDDDAEDSDFSGTVLVAVGDNEKEVEAMILAQEKRLIADAENTDDAGKTTSETREFRGVELHITNVTEDEFDIQTGWAVADGVLAFASPGESLERAVAAILDGGVENTITTGAGFATVSSHVRKADSWLFMDMAPLAPAIQEVAETAAAVAREAGSPFPIDPTAVVQGLGVDAMQAFFATFSMDKTATIMDFGLTFTDNRGLIKLLAYGPGDAPRPTFIRADTDAFTTVTYGFGEAWSALVDIVNTINPSLTAMAAMQLQSTAQNAEVELDLKRDLLDNLTGEVVTIQNFGGISGTTIADLELQQDQVIVLGITDRAALENAIAGVTAIAGQGPGLFSSRPFEEHTIFSLDHGKSEDEATGNKISYAITDDHWLISIGSPTTLEDTLGGMNAKNGSVWNQRKVQRALATLPGGAASIQYQDPADLGDLVFRGIAMADGFDEGEEEGFEICDPDAIPDAGIVAKYFSSAVAGIWKDDRHLVIRARILPAEMK
jgi:hypothetical protein